MNNESLANDLVLVLTTEADRIIADELVKELLKRRVAACISIREVQSYYWWNEEIEQTNEIQLLIKTTKAQLQSLMNNIEELHTYQNPELLFWEVSGSDGYKKWVNDVVSPP